MSEYSRETLRAYLADALPDGELAAVEKALREEASLRALLDEVRDEVDRGEHSIGAIWRRERLTCPSREQLGNFLLQALEDDRYDYVKFHLETIGCPFCRANLDDLKKSPGEGETVVRRRRIVDSSAGVLRDAGR